MIRLALPLIGHGNWTGGYNYLRNMLHLIRSRLADEIEPWVFVTQEEADKFGEEVAALVDGRLIVDRAGGVSGRGKRLLLALLTGKDAQFERLLKAHGIDVVLETASFYGVRLGIPVIAWMPDFQHRHLPQMFSRTNWWRRELGFRMELMTRRTLMVSSKSARDDLERFYPAARGRSHVVRFTVNCDIDAIFRQRLAIRKIYDLPDRYFFLPNQFWRHKNHALVIDALAYLKAEGALTTPMVLTGPSGDSRNPQYYDGLMARAREVGVLGHFRHLGLIPYDHVLSLNADCAAMINPSYFEGWSTPVEESKAFATPLILSNIPIHCEQAPHALFFDPKSPQALARALYDSIQRPKKRRPRLEELIANQEDRLDDYASNLLGTVRAAVRS